MFALNDEEKEVLRIVREHSDRGERLDYYKLVGQVKSGGDTSTMIPVVSRLEDDGYITSNGLIYRYLHITDKGRNEVAGT